MDKGVGFHGVRSDIVLLRPPDGHGKVDLSKFHSRRAIDGAPHPAPANTLGLRRVMFVVDDLDGVLARLRAHGAELVGAALRAFEASFHTRERRDRLGEVPCCPRMGIYGPR